MKNKISKFLFILSAIIALYVIRAVFSEYNLNKTMSACILAQTSESKDIEKAKKFCKKEIIKKKRD